MRSIWFRIRQWVRRLQIEYKRTYETAKKVLVFNNFADTCMSTRQIRRCGTKSEPALKLNSITIQNTARSYIITPIIIQYGLSAQFGKRKRQSVPHNRRADSKHWMTGAHRLYLYIKESLSVNFVLDSSEVYGWCPSTRVYLKYHLEDNVNK